jgi:uncharacterized protein YkwD
VLHLWRESPRHDANLLRAGVSKLGVGVALAPESRYRTYWCLVLAQRRAESTGTNHTP